MDPRSAHTGSWEHPLPALPKEPRAGSATSAETPGNSRKACFPQGKHSSSLRFPKYRGSTAKPLFFIFPQGCGPQQHRFLFQLDPGIARIPQRVLRLRGGDSELQRFPRATGTEGLQKTPEQSNSVSASSSFQKHIEKRIILGQSFKIHKWHFLKAQERKKKGLRGIWNYFKPSPNLVQDANMQITIRAGAYFYSASP